MAEVSVLSVAQAVATPSFVACTGGGDHYLPVGRKCLVYVKNGGGTQQTVTVNDPTSTSPTGAKAFDADVDFIIPNAQERIFAIDPVRFTNPANGRVEIAYSGVTSMTIAVIALGI